MKERLSARLLLIFVNDIMKRNIVKKIISATLICSMMISVSACSKSDSDETSKKTDSTFMDATVPSEICQYSNPVDGELVATFFIKDYGEIKVKFFQTIAPKAVENFITHAKEGYYDGVTFHRVMDEFMIQGGDPLGTGTGGESIWGASFEDEFSLHLMPVRGALCMANAGTNTNGSQFFIVQTHIVHEEYVDQLLDVGIDRDLVDYYVENGGAAWLYGKHTVFGQVYEGMDVVDKIAATATDENNKPLDNVIIEKIEVSTY